MAKGDVFEVRFGRVPMSLFGLIGALFLLAGLDMAVFHRVLTFDVDPDKRILFGLLQLFFIAIGGVVVGNCGWYVLRPPVMLRLSPEGVTFGTGFRYRPFTIPWRHVKSAGYGLDRPNLSPLETWNAGFRVEFEPSPDVPAWKATSIGIGYAFHRLVISGLYANRFPWTTLRAFEEFRRRYGSPVPPKP